jgi:hypothetical protein
MQVFGVPAALGAATAVGTASLLNADVGLSVGLLTAAVGSLLYGYYVTAGFDRRLVTQLSGEAVSRQEQQEQSSIYQAVQSADPVVRGPLERIFYQYQSIDAAFSDGIDDSVEAVLVGSRDDLRQLSSRALQLGKLYQRLGSIIEGSNGQWLEAELGRITNELRRAAPGSVRDALEEARRSTERTLEQWRAAVDKQRQILSVLTVIEKNLQEFKLAMELRKADEALGASTSTPDVSELQARLTAAGQACDEIVGSGAAGHRTARRAR